MFGEVGPGRNLPNDPVNTFLRNKYLKDYLEWHFQNRPVYEGMQSDLSYLKFSSYMTLGYAALGVVFAGVIFNPNYTSRHSFYMRKLTPVFFGAIGYQWGKKKQADQVTSIMLRLHDYMPRPVRRTWETKDYRHMVGFNYESAPFCQHSGKSLQ